MNRLEGRSRDSFLEKGILKMIRVKSAERVETDKREPHKITSPFVLESPHTHQDPKAAETSPATFLTCAIRKKEGVLGDLMGIKSEKKEKKETHEYGLYAPVKTQKNQTVKEKHMPKK